MGVQKRVHLQLHLVQSCLLSVRFEEINDVVGRGGVRTGNSNMRETVAQPSTFGATDGVPNPLVTIQGVGRGTLLNPFVRVNIATCNKSWGNCSTLRHLVIWKCSHVVRKAGAWWVPLPTYALQTATLKVQIYPQFVVILRIRRGDIPSSPVIWPHGLYHEMTRQRNRFSWFATQEQPSDATLHTSDCCELLGQSSSKENSHFWT